MKKLINILFVILISFSITESRGQFGKNKFPINIPKWSLNEQRKGGITIDPKDKVDRALLNPPAKPGNAPTFKKDGKSVEIHHEGQNSEGPFIEMHPEDHRGQGKDIINHPEKMMPSKIDRKDFKKKRTEYWRDEYPQ